MPAAPIPSRKPISSIAATHPPRSSSPEPRDQPPSDVPTIRDLTRHVPRKARPLARKQEEEDREERGDEEQPPPRAEGDRGAEEPQERAEVHRVPHERIRPGRDHPLVGRHLDGRRRERVLPEDAI